MLVERIDALFYEQNNEKRNYLGASAVGHPCQRHVQFNWLVILGRIPPKKFPPRIKRIFDRGHRYEAAMREWMLAVGINFEVNDDLLQFADFEGKFRGHVDGVLINFKEDKRVLWECKALGEKPWEKLNSVGLRISKPEYYIQVQLYMHYLGLDECLFTAINMNTMAIYEERVVLDFECIENTQLLVKNVFSFTDRNKFLPKSMNKYDCTYCDYKEHCK